MNEEYIKEQLLDGLKNLKRDLEIMTNMYFDRGLFSSHPALEHALKELKLNYVERSLEVIKDS